MEPAAWAGGGAGGPPRASDSAPAGARASGPVEGASCPRAILTLAQKLSKNAQTESVLALPTPDTENNNLKLTSCSCPFEVQVMKKFDVRLTSAMSDARYALDGFALDIRAAQSKRLRQSIWALTIDGTCASARLVSK